MQQPSLHLEGNVVTLVGIVSALLGVPTILQVLAETLLIGPARFEDAAVMASLRHTAAKNKQIAGTDGTTTVRLSGGFTTTVSARGARLSSSCSGLMGMSSATS